MVFASFGIVGNLEQVVHRQWHERATTFTTSGAIAGKATVENSVAKIVTDIKKGEIAFTHADGKRVKITVE